MRFQNNFTKIVLKTELHKTDLDIRGHSRGEKTTFVIVEQIQYPIQSNLLLKWGHLLVFLGITCLMQPPGFLEPKYSANDLVLRGLLS